MSPSRKRRIRLIVALSSAVLLASALAYTSFSAATEATTPSQLRSKAAGRTYQLTGVVAKDSVQRSRDRLRFTIRDRKGSATVPIDYTGIVPDPFREGREVIVTGQLKNGTFVANRDSLVTKCPSKFQKQPATSQS